MLEILRTDFQLRLLWGSRGAAVDQTERYDKFKLILTALSRKLEPPVKHTELWKTRHLYIHIRLSEPLCGVRSKVICIWKRTFSTRMWASIDHMQIASWKPFMSRNGTCLWRATLFHKHLPEVCCAPHLWNEQVPVLPSRKEGRVRWIFLISNISSTVWNA